MNDLTLLLIGLLLGGMMVAFLRGQTHVTIQNVPSEQPGPSSALVILIILAIGALFVALIQASV